MITGSLGTGTRTMKIKGIEARQCGFKRRRGDESCKYNVAGNNVRAYANDSSGILCAIVHRPIAGV